MPSPASAATSAKALDDNSKGEADAPKTTSDYKELPPSFCWPPLESNPQVFTDYLHTIGLSPKYEIGEVIGFDEELLNFVPQPLYGIIVAFERTAKGRKKKEEEKNNLVDDNNSESGGKTKDVKFFMRQSGTLDNACGIIACLHAILNNNERQLEMIRPESVLHKFQNTTESQTPTERCASLEKDAQFQTYHKTFASKGQSKAITSVQDNVRHHFVSFIVQNGYLLELDGTKKAPNVIGQCEDVLRGSISEMQRRLKNNEVTESLSMMTLQINI